MNPEKIKFFADYIHSHLGIVYSETNYFQLENRLNEISKSLGFENAEQLWFKAQIGVTGEMKQLLLDAATNNETSFFRDPAIFKAIEKTILPQIASRLNGRKSISIWCAASSTGQEPYSLAMLISELSKKITLPQVEILATDISDRVLEKSKAGLYTQIEVQRGLPANILIKYFTKVDHSGKELTQEMWAIDPKIRSMVAFKKINLIDPWTKFGPFDLILCRNVLIYQNVENKKKVISKISDSLFPEGFFILGAAESLLGLSDQFEQVTSEGAVLYKKKIQSQIAA
jgi:chemotaxis protein methyltransferase CheR